MIGQLHYLSDKKARTHIVKNSYTSLGRNKYCDIRIEEENIAPKHCLIVCKNGSPAIVRSLSTTNAILINGTLLKGNYELKDNDIITLGSKSFEWTYVDNISSKQEEDFSKSMNKRKRDSEPPALHGRLIAIVSPQSRQDHQKEQNTRSTSFNQASASFLPPNKRRKTLNSEIPTTSSRLSQISSPLKRIQNERTRIPQTNKMKFSRNELQHIPAYSNSGLRTQSSSRIPIRFNSKTRENASKPNTLNTNGTPVGKCGKLCRHMKTPTSNVGANPNRTLQNKTPNNLSNFNGSSSARYNSDNLSSNRVTPFKKITPKNSTNYAAIKRNTSRNIRETRSGPVTPTTKFGNSDRYYTPLNNPIRGTINQISSGSGGGKFTRTSYNKNLSLRRNTFSTGKKLPNSNRLQNLKQSTNVSSPYSPSRQSTFIKMKSEKLPQTETSRTGPTSSHETQTVDNEVREVLAECVQEAQVTSTTPSNSGNYKIVMRSSKKDSARRRIFNSQSNSLQTGEDQQEIPAKRNSSIKTASDERSSVKKDSSVINITEQENTAQKKVSIKDNSFSSNKKKSPNAKVNPGSSTNKILLNSVELTNTKDSFTLSCKSSTELLPPESPSPVKITVTSRTPTRDSNEELINSSKFNATSELKTPDYQTSIRRSLRTSNSTKQLIGADKLKKNTEINSKSLYYAVKEDNRQSRKRYKSAPGKLNIYKTPATIAVNSALLESNKVRTLSTARTENVSIIPSPVSDNSSKYSSGTKLSFKVRRSGGRLRRSSQQSGKSFTLSAKKSQSSNKTQSILNSDTEEENSSFVSERKINTTFEIVDESNDSDKNKKETAPVASNIYVMEGYVNNVNNRNCSDNTGNVRPVTRRSSLFEISASKLYSSTPRDFNKTTSIKMVWDDLGENSGSVSSSLSRSSCNFLSLTSNSKVSAVVEGESKLEKIKSPEKEMEASSIFNNSKTIRRSKSSSDLGLTDNWKTPVKENSGTEEVAETPRSSRKYIINNMEKSDCEKINITSGSLRRSSRMSSVTSGIKSGKKKFTKSPKIDVSNNQVTPQRVEDKVTPNSFINSPKLRRSSRKHLTKIYSPVSPMTTPKHVPLPRRKAITDLKTLRQPELKLKRELDALFLEKSKAAAKRLKAEPPKLLDKKKVAALLLCHKKKSPLKIVVPQTTPQKSVLKIEHRNEQGSFQYSTPIVKQLRFATSTDDSTPFRFTGTAIVNHQKTPARKKTNQQETVEDKDSTISSTTTAEDQIEEKKTDEENDIFSALYLSRKTMQTTPELESDKPRRRLRSSVNKSKPSPESTPSKCVKRVFFATPIADFSDIPSSSEKSAQSSGSTDKQSQSPDCDYTDVSNLKKIFEVTPQPDYSKVSGVKKALQLTPQPDYTKVSGIKKALQVTPQPDYTKVSGVKKALQITPQPDYTKVSGIKSLQITPPQSKSNSNVVGGAKKPLQFTSEHETTANVGRNRRKSFQLSPHSNFTNVIGVKDLLSKADTCSNGSPKIRVFTTSPVANYTDVTGVKQIFTALPTSDTKGGLKELFPADSSELLLNSRLKVNDPLTSGQSKKEKIVQQTTPQECEVKSTMILRKRKVENVTGGSSTSTSSKPNSDSGKVKNDAATSSQIKGKKLRSRTAVASDDKNYEKKITTKIVRKNKVEKTTPSSTSVSTRMTRSKSKNGGKAVDVTDNSSKGANKKSTTTTDHPKIQKPLPKDQQKVALSTSENSKIGKQTKKRNVRFATPSLTPNTRRTTRSRSKNDNKADKEGSKSKKKVENSVQRKLVNNLPATSTSNKLNGGNGKRVKANEESGKIIVRRAKKSNVDSVHSKKSLKKVVETPASDKKSTKMSSKAINKSSTESKSIKENKKLSANNKKTAANVAGTLRVDTTMVLTSKKIKPRLSTQKSGASQNVVQKKRKAKRSSDMKINTKRETRSTSRKK